MMFINSFRIFFSNFSQFWKSILYKLVAIIVAGLFLLPFLNVYKAVDFSVFLENFKQLFLNISFLNISLYFELLYNTLLKLFEIVNNLFVLNPFCLIYTCSVVFILLPFLIHLADVALGEVIYGSMSSLTKVSFIGSFLKKIGKSTIYSIFKILISLPVFALILYIEFLIVKFGAQNDTLVIFAPILLVLVYALIWGLRDCFISGWLPSIIVFPCGTFKAFARGLKVLSRRFFRVLSTTCCFVFMWCALTCLFGAVSLLIILPVAFMIQVIFEMVMFFGSQGMRYYVDLDTILTPKRLEETDKIGKAKQII